MEADWDFPEFPWENVYGNVQREIPFAQGITLTEHEETFRSAAITHVMETWNGEIPKDAIAATAKALAWINSL